MDNIMQIWMFSGVKQSKLCAVFLCHCLPRLWFWPGGVWTADVSGPESAVRMALVAPLGSGSPLGSSARWLSAPSQPPGAELSNSQGHLHPPDNKTHAVWNKITKEQMAKGQAVACLICPCLWGSNCLLRPWKLPGKYCRCCFHGTYDTVYIGEWSLVSPDPRLADISFL